MYVVIVPREPRTTAFPATWVDSSLDWGLSAACAFIVALSDA